MKKEKECKKKRKKLVLFFTEAFYEREKRDKKDRQL